MEVTRVVTHVFLTLSNVKYDRKNAKQNHSGIPTRATTQGSASCLLILIACSATGAAVFEFFRLQVEANFQVVAPRVTSTG